MWRTQGRGRKSQDRGGVEQAGKKIASDHEYII